MSRVLSLLGLVLLSLCLATASQAGIDVCPVKATDTLPNNVSACPGGSGSGSGAGTVTNTGTLAANQLIMGNGGVDVSTALAPIELLGADGTTQMAVEYTAAATEYPTFTAGATGIGAIFGVTASATDAQVNFAAQGAGRVNHGNGSYATPIMSYGPGLSAQAAYPTIDRILDSGSRVSTQLMPGTNGGLMTRPTDATSGGLAIGSGAVDLQLPGTGCTFTTTNRIASGQNAFATGCNNTASGLTSVAMGGSSNATAQSAFALGQSAIATGSFSHATGRQVSDNGYYGTFVHGSSQRSANGDSQWRKWMLVQTVANGVTSAQRLTSDRGAASTTNTGNLGNFKTLYVRCDVVAQNVGADHSISWEVKGMLSRGTNAAATAWTASTGTAGVSAGESHGSPGTPTLTAAADTTNGGLNLTFTDAAALAGGWNVVASCQAPEAS